MLSSFGDRFTQFNKEKDAKVNEQRIAKFGVEVDKTFVEKPLKDFVEQSFSVFHSLVVVCVGGDSFVVFVSFVV